MHASKQLSAARSCSAVPSVSTPASLTCTLKTAARHHCCKRVVSLVGALVDALLAVDAPVAAPFPSAAGPSCEAPPLLLPASRGVSSASALRRLSSAFSGLLLVCYRYVGVG